MTRQHERRSGPTTEEPHDHDRGLRFDLSTLLDRRQMLKLAAGASLLSLTAAACGGGADSAITAAATGSTTSEPSGTGASGTTCAAVPEETAGPFPADGSNGVNVLSETGIVRTDIRPSFGTATGTADGVPLTIELVVVDQTAGCAPVEGAAVYVWHCDREGLYSLYSEGATDENYLRGVQATDADGRVRFTSIFPACYSGRWPHVHFEVYESIDAAAAGEGLVATSQLAFPADVCELVYATDGYAQSVENLSQVSLESDNVFGDGAELQLATVTGSVEDGLVAALQLGV